ncbi:MAG: hypothetical protein JSS35_16420 [Proteobacteria bacterium]|nr:hypothetical protein [Pseudomonadota bacterium]
MRRLMGLAAMAALAAPGAAAAGICRSQDFMPTYFAFADRTRDLPVDQRVEAFVAEVVKPNPEFYGHGFGDTDRLRRSAARFLDPAKPPAYPGFAPLTEGRLREVSTAAAAAFEKAQDDFQKAFPDFTCAADISFGVSLMHFDGNGFTDDAGREHMRFGLDVIAMLHTPQDMPAFFSHELFHIYHAQALPGVEPEDDSRTWWAMWAEGLATYVSLRLNQPLAEQQVLWFPADLADQMNRPGMMRKAAVAMLADFDKGDGATYGSYFQSGSHAPGLPSRVGYFMGLRMAEQLGRTRTLRDLAHLPPQEVKALSRQFLERQAR